MFWIVFEFNPNYGLYVAYMRHLVQIFMKYNNSYRLSIIVALILSLPVFLSASAFALTLTSTSTQTAATGQPVNQSEVKPIDKVLFIGDSMTGWMSERFNAYGVVNGFDVATIVWDGSTIKKWSNVANLAKYINQQNPDVVFISLGMNELFEPNPSKTLESAVNKILAAVGNRDVVWIGPPSWPGHNKGKVLDDWLADKLGDGRYFSTFTLDLPRQSKTNPHPTRAGIIKWIDQVVDWIPGHTNLNFESLNRPVSNAMSRGKSFVYKRMKESL